MDDNKIIKKQKLNIDVGVIEDICNCIICHDYIGQKAMICINSHYTCTSCYDSNRKKECAYCKQKMGKVDISVPYKLYESLELDIKCPFGNCGKNMSIKDYHTHKEKCPHRYYNCIYSNCDYIHENNIFDVGGHYLINHRYQLIVCDETNILCPIIVRGNTDYEIPSNMICKYNDNILIEITTSCMKTVYNQSNPPIIAYPISLYIRLIPLNYTIDLPKVQFEISGKKNHQVRGGVNNDGMTCIIVLAQVLKLYNSNDEYKDDAEKKATYPIYDSYKNYFEIKVTKIES